MHTCPSCDRPINPASDVCPYCGERAAPVAPAKRRQLQRRGLLVTLAGSALVIGGVWALVWFVLPRPSSPPRAQAEAFAVSSLQQVAGAVAAYAKLGGSYPNSIEQVSGDTRAAFEGAFEQGYHLVYRAGTAGSDGNIHTYILLARPTYYGYRNFYTDQTGVIRSTRQNRPATAQDPPIS
ncbi:MAG TPA: hypothetical protein VGS20_15885 [Candidatus Acidoferrales bacterium]|nr:hypothetical protein [Candidatus Acidoferrales bacterium]